MKAELLYFPFFIYNLYSVNNNNLAEPNSFKFIEILSIKSYLLIMLKNIHETNLLRI